MTKLKVHLVHANERNNKTACQMYACDVFTSIHSMLKICFVFSVADTTFRISKHECPLASNAHNAHILSCVLFTTVVALFSSCPILINPCSTYGSHHWKRLLMYDADGLRVVIGTANFLQRDFINKTTVYECRWCRWSLIDLLECNLLIFCRIFRWKQTLHPHYPNSRKICSDILPKLSLTTQSYVFGRRIAPAL